MQRLCALDEIEENAGRGFTVELGGQSVAILVVRRQGRAYGYRNTCPHRGTTLDWMPDRFMDPEREYLQCSTHDARFRVEDGFCVAGPCRGDSLTPVPLAVEDGQVLLGGG